MKFSNYAIVGSGLCSFIASLKVKKCLVLTKFSNKKTDVVRILNFYELNNLGGNSNIWGGYINLDRFKKLLNSSKKFSNFYYENDFFITSKISKNKSFKKVGYIKDKKKKKIFRLDSSFFKNLHNFNLNKILIKKNHINLVSKNYILKVKKVNLCLGNIGLIKVLRQSNLISDNDIISYDDSSIKYLLNFNLDHKKYYYIPMSIRQIFEKLFYKSKYYKKNDNNKNLFVQAVSNKKIKFRYSVKGLLNSKKNFHRGLTTNHIANLRINDIPIENFLKKKSKRIIVNCSGVLPKYIPGSISQDLIFNTFIKS